MLEEISELLCHNKKLTPEAVCYLDLIGRGIPNIVFLGVTNTHVGDNGEPEYKYNYEVRHEDGNVKTYVAYCLYGGPGIDLGNTLQFAFSGFPTLIFHLSGICFRDDALTFEFENIEGQGLVAEFANEDYIYDDNGIVVYKLTRQEKLARACCLAVIGQILKTTQGNPPHDSTSETR